MLSELQRFDGGKLVGLERPAPLRLERHAQFAPVLDPQHQRIDALDAERIAMRDEGRVLAPARAEIAKPRAMPAR